MNSPFFALIKKDLKGYFDQPTGYILLVVFVSILSWSFFKAALLLGEASLRPLFSVNFAIDQPSLPWIMAIFIPAATMRLLSEEQRDGTLETLLTQPIRGWVILIAKFIAGLIFVSISILATLSIPISIISAGNLDWGAVFAQYLASIFLAGSLVSIGLFTSSLTRNQIVAFIIGLTLSMGLMIVGLDIVAVTLPSSLATLLQLLSPITHFSNVGRGIIDLRDILYFLSLISVFLSATFLIIKGRTLSHKTAQYRNLQLGVGGLIILSILIGWFGSSIQGRLDLTEDKIFSLTPATIDIVNSLEDLMTIDLFLSENPAVEITTVSRDVNDFLIDLEANSNGMVKIVKHYPENDPVAERKAQNAGIQPTPFQTIDQGNLEINNSYLGLTLTYLDKREAIGFVSSVDGFEYRLVSLANKMLSELSIKKKVGFLSGHGETDPTREFDTFARLLSQQYDITRIDPDENQEIDLNEIDVLIVSSPKSRLPENHRSSIKEYIELGGKSLFLIEPVLVDYNQFTGIPNRENSSDFVFSEFGISVEEDIVFDMQSHETISSNTGVSAMYPYFIKAEVSDSKVGGEVNSVVMPWASSVGVIGNNSSEYKISPLLSTTEFGAIDFTYRNLSPNAPIFSEITRAELVQSDVGMIAEGQNGSRTAVISDSEWLQEFAINRFAGNYLFGLNVIDWLAQEDNLASVRSKIATRRDLVFSSDTHKTIVQTFNTIGMPIIFISIAFIRYFQRRSKGFRQRLINRSNKSQDLENN